MVFLIKVKFRSVHDMKRKSKKSVRISNFNGIGFTHQYNRIPSVKSILVQLVKRGMQKLNIKIKYLRCEF